MLTLSRAIRLPLKRILPAPSVRFFSTEKSSDFSTIDTNVTTFAIKSPLDRVIKDKESRYGWPVNEDNIAFRFQQLKKTELDLLYKKLEHEGKISKHEDDEDNEPYRYFKLLDEEDLLNLWPRGKFLQDAY